MLFTDRKLFLADCGKRTNCVDVNATPRLFEQSIEKKLSVSIMTCNLRTVRLPYGPESRALRTVRTVRTVTPLDPTKNTWNKAGIYFKCQK